MTAAIILQRLSLPRALIVNLFCSEMDFPEINFTLICGLKLLRIGKNKREQKRLWKRKANNIKKLKK